MTRKQFIKRLRAAGIERNIINYFCALVKSAGGQISYQNFYRQPNIKIMTERN